MRQNFRFCAGIMVLLTMGGFGANQPSAEIRTRDTVIRLAAEPEAPQVVTLASGELPAWSNTVPEKLIDSVDISGKPVKVSWQFDPSASSIDSHDTAFVYDCKSPHLRLTWEWNARAEFGPIEHQVRIENLDDQEIWLPLQPSLQFKLKIDPQAKLEQLYVEKGADTPADVGTHLVQVGAGYRWRGTSSTYAHPKENEPREIIPWFLVEEIGGSRNGWYVGVEFSGRTELRLQREGELLKTSMGLNPPPAARRSSSRTPLLGPGPLRTGRDSFPSSGSSTSNASGKETRFGYRKT